jgi:hypothetical protein
VKRGERAGWESSAAVMGRDGGMQQVMDNLEKAQVGLDDLLGGNWVLGGGGARVSWAVGREGRNGGRIQHNFQAAGFWVRGEGKY